MPPHRKFLLGRPLPFVPPSCPLLVLMVYLPFTDYRIPSSFALLPGNKNYRTLRTVIITLIMRCIVSAMQHLLLFSRLGVELELKLDHHLLA